MKKSAQPKSLSEPSLSAEPSKAAENVGKVSAEAGGKPKKGGGARTPESLEKRKKEGQWFVRQLYSQRWVRMHEMMDTGGAYTAPQFAQALEAPLRTIEDDLKFMRGGLEMPIVYDRKRGGHCFTEEYVPMPGRRFDESDAMSFALTRKLTLMVMAGTHVGVRALRAIDKMFSIAGGNVRRRSQRYANLIHLRNLRPQAVFDADISELILDCADQRLELEMVYEKTHTDAPEQRTVQPRYLVGTPLGWYMLVNDPKGPGRLRTFALARIRQARRLGSRFEDVPADVEAHFRHHIGIFGGLESKPERVRLIFERNAGRIASELPPHPTCRTTVLPDGRIEMIMDAAIDQELKNWIGAWRSDVRVMEPPALLESFRLEHRKMAEWYG